MNLSDNLKKIRKDNNLSQEQLAEKLNVSRQSVSKWESGQAYPEMDKMIQLCKMFNLNIDELLNQDIREVNNTKQSKININKYIDDFLEYVSKTINMFINMNFTTKIKCLIEQFMLIIFFLIIIKIFGGILSDIVGELLLLIPKSIYYFIYGTLKIVYGIVTLILGVILLLYIFKIRYLDYYVVSDDDKVPPKENKNDDKKSDTINSECQPINNADKIIIRDPKHSSYRFISSLLKLFVFALKIFAIFIAIMFCFSFVTLTIFTLLSFIFVKTGTIFIGGLILLIASLIINIIILIVLYNFIFSKKSKKNRLAITFLVSLFAIGCGIGIISIGLTQFELVNNYDSAFFVEKEIVVEMKDNLFIQTYSNIEYIEENNTNVKIVYKYTPYYELETYNDETGVFFYNHINKSNYMKLINACIKDINNKKIYDYSSSKVYIYTNKENILKLKDNLDNYINR